MDLKEWKLMPVQEEKYNFQEFDDEGEGEETLSLCDFALNSYNVSDSDGWFKEDRQSSHFDQEIFEFFTGDLSSSTFPKENIIFCGKLIPHKGDEEDENQANNSVNATEKLKTTTKRSCIFPWKSKSFNIIPRSISLKMQREKSYRTCKTFPEESSEKYFEDKYDITPAKKVTRWYLLAFGVGRYPVEMELKDMKTRQNKLTDSKMRRSRSRPANEKAEKSGKREKSWWGLLRILGCQNSHANAMVKNSFGWMSNV